MKKFFGFNKLLASVAVLASVMIFQSCLDDDDNDYYRYALPNALVTVKPVADNSFFMQLDDSTTLLPVNMKNSPYGEKEVRALVNFDPVTTTSSTDSLAFSIRSSNLSFPFFSPQDVTANTVMHTNTVNNCLFILFLFDYKLDFKLCSNISI